MNEEEILSPDERFLESIVDKINSLPTLEAIGILRNQLKDAFLSGGDAFFQCLTEARYSRMNDKFYQYLRINSNKNASQPNGMIVSNGTETTGTE